MLETQSVPADSGSQRLIQWLGYLGLIPFIVPAIGMLQAKLTGPGLQAASIGGFYAPYVFVAYSAVILSFLSGVLWGKARQSMTSDKTNMLLITSNIISVLAWVSLLMIYISPLMMLFAVTILLCGYATMLLAEFSIDADYESVTYWRLRLLLTVSVIAAHSLILVLLIGDL